MIIDKLLKSFPSVNVDENETILVDDSAYLGNFSQTYVDVMSSIRPKNRTILKLIILIYPIILTIIKKLTLFFKII
jgi:hypothetical protein